MSISSTGLSDYEKKPTTSTATAAISGGDDIGGFGLDEFGRIMGGISKSQIYAEARKGRLKLSKSGDRTIVTRVHARQYTALIASEAEARIEAGTKLRPRGDADVPDRAEKRAARAAEKAKPEVAHRKG